MNIYDDYISCHELKKILKGPKYKTLRNKINDRGIRISLDGNVGSGKSAVINFLRNYRVNMMYMKKILINGHLG